MKLQIVIAQRGWVFIGQSSLEGDYIVLENAKVIRRWGTTKGLGQLALEGPTNNTVLDECGRVVLHKLSIVATINVVSSGW